MDGAHTHGHGPIGLGELVAIGLGVALAAEVLARVLTLLLIALAAAGGVLVIGLIGYVVLACRRYQQQITVLGASANLDQLAGQGARAVALERAEVRELRRLAPPAEDAGAIDRMLKTVESATVAGDALVAAARSHDAKAVADAAATLRTQLATANRLAKPFGLDVCAR